MIFRRTKDDATDVETTDVADTEPEPTPAPEAAATWQAGTASWWAISVVITALAITAFTGLRTVSTVSEEVPATRILESVLRAPTADLLAEELADADADTTRLDARDDLVAFDVPVAEAENDFDGTVNEIIAERATELYTDGIPGDPGPTRTQVGLPRRFVSALTVDNHDAVGDSVRYAGILVLALLGWTLLQGRNDNLLMLPAGALATGWVLSTASLEAVDLLLSDIGPGSSRAVRTIEQAAEQPMAQLSLLTMAALASAAFFRILTLAQRWLARRRTVDDVEPTADQLTDDDLAALLDTPEPEAPDEIEDPVLVESVPRDGAVSTRPIRAVPVRRRMDVDA